MDGMITAPQRNPTTVAAMVFAGAAVVLGGYAILLWWDAIPLLRSVSGPAPEAADPVWGAFGVPPGTALLIAGLCLSAAVTLFWHARHSPSHDLGLDAKTGLYSPEYAARAAAGLIARDDENGRSRLALVQVRIDQLDDVRRRLGPAAADQLTMTIGRHIRSQTRGVDLPALTRGNDFVVFLRCAELEQTTAFCRRIATLLRADQLEWKGEVVKVSASMGVALRRPGEALEALQARARQNLATAQEDGPGRIVA